MTTTNASGLFAAIWVGVFIAAVIVASGLIDRLAWAVGGGW